MSWLFTKGGQQAADKRETMKRYPQKGNHEKMPTKEKYGKPL
ncbi:MAG: hypothetical protein RR754_00625 [Oscillospiraceae bacterium]